MQNQEPTNFSDPFQLILLVIGLLLVALVLYLAVRIFSGRRDLDGPYFVKLFIVALLIYIAVIVVGAVIGALGTIGDSFSAAFPIIVFTAAIYIIDYLLIESRDKDHSILIALVTFIFLYVLEFIFTQLNSSWHIIPIV